jgi:hypothetical protein
MKAIALVAAFPVNALWARTRVRTLIALLGYLVQKYYIAKAQVQ